MRILAIDSAVYDDVRTSVCDWLEANGVSPRHVVAHGPIQVDDDTITLKTFVIDGFGNRILHRCCDGVVESHFAKRSLTVPLVQPLPPELDAYVVVSA